MNIVSAVSWTDIQTEVMITSAICNQDSDLKWTTLMKSFFFTVGVLKRLTFSLHKDVENAD